MKYKSLIFISTFFISVGFSNAQEVDSLMNQMSPKKDEGKVIATFKSSRLILSQTTTMVKKNNLDFKVVHRFGDIGGDNGGSKTLFGLDNSSDIYIDFDYGISDRLNIGFGRSKYSQLLDLQLKYALLQQSEDNKMPLSVSLLAKTGFEPQKVVQGYYANYGERFSYLGQAIISRKFSKSFSLQLSPTVLQRGKVLSANDEETLFALGAAARYKFTKRFGIVADYYLIKSDFRKNNPTTNYYSPLGLGFEIETGGHVFTLNFVNAEAIVENNFLPNSTSSFTKGQYRFGFTISRMFSFNKEQPIVKQH
ncbi:MAG: hypothetical protein JWN56_1569 [Sphingobacteriales bacterium]|nr:hypothetical protein [Sphingobacteriales bacterium]